MGGTPAAATPELEAVNNNVILGGVLALVWISLNITLTFINKYLFSHEDFQYPVFIIMVGTLVTWLGAMTIVFLLKINVGPRASWREILSHWKILALLALLHAYTSSFSNVSIVYISISLSQLLKATSPALTIILARIFEGTRTSLPVIGATCIIIVGAALTIFEDPEGEKPDANKEERAKGLHEHIIGILFSLMSEFSGAGQMVTSAILLQRIKLSSWDIMLSTSLPMILFMLPIFAYRELGSILTLDIWNSRIVFMVLFSGVGALFYTLANFLLILYTSSVFTSVVANLKVVLLVSLSLVLFPTKFNAYKGIGMSVAFSGFLLYNYLKFRERVAQIREQKRGGGQTLNINNADGDIELESLQGGEREADDDIIERENTRRRGGGLVVEEGRGGAGGDDEVVIEMWPQHNTPKTRRNSK